jgi:hypothetical protein
MLTSQAMNRRAFVAGLGAVLAAPRDEWDRGWKWRSAVSPSAPPTQSPAIGPKMGDWPLILCHMGFYNWEYVTRAR